MTGYDTLTGYYTLNISSVTGTVVFLSLFMLIFCIDCSVNHGGCAALANCSSSGCGPCPSGTVGTGSTICTGINISF